VGDDRLSQNFCCLFDNGQHDTSFPELEAKVTLPPFSCALLR